MKNKKGFTLVELLAVVAILGILVLLVAPNVISTYEKSREDLRVQTVRTYIREAQKYYAKLVFSNSDLLGEDVNLFDKLEVSGGRIENGYIIATEEGEIKVALEIDGKCYKNDGDAIVSENSYLFCDVHDRVHDDVPGELAGVGSVSNPFKIESVEDLVAFSNIII